MVAYRGGPGGRYVSTDDERRNRTDAVRDLPGGDFATWLSDMRSAFRGQRHAEVPCGDCTACCSSSQFIHVAPDETDTIAHIPGELLFRAPGLPDGWVLLGYDERGRCPMLADDGCSIYLHRPRTCRTYDCRIFAATGLDPEGVDKAPIARHARRWELSYASDDDRVRHEAIRLAASFLHDNPACFPGGKVPADTTQLAVVAVGVHDVFLHTDDETGRLLPATPAPEVVASAVGLLGEPRPFHTH